jgi:TrmH family RNA methyltransferase
MSPKDVKKLADKKYRNETGLFIVEGEKNIRELLNSDFVVTDILGTRSFIDSIFTAVSAYDERMQERIELREMKEADIEKTGTFVTNAFGIAVAKQKEERNIEDVIAEAKENIVLILDDIRDPGNLGTIIRIADWFGVTSIIASKTTTDCYSPKVISSTMGSFTRVPVTYADLENVLTRATELGLPVVATLMDGKNVHETTLPPTGLLLMGSESHGVSEESLRHATDRVTIPRFGKAESLNVSVATGILLDAMRRK